MKCVFILPNLGAGGAERVVTLLSKEFISLSIEVDIVLLLDDLIEYDIPSGVNIVKLNAVNNSKIERVQVLRRYLKKITSKNAKVVAIPFHDSCLKTVLLAAIGIKIDIVASERNNPYIKGTSFIKKVAANLPYLMATKCVFQTEEAMQYYCKFVRDKSIVIENPIESMDKYRWNGNKSRRIISVGRLQEQKNHALLIDAFKEIYEMNSNYSLVIYGEGPLRDFLLDKIRFYNLHDVISLKGHTKNIYEELVKSEFFVLSSDYEGMSNALIEAMSIGMPVISTDHPIGGARSLIINEENGLLTSVGNKDELITAMKKMINNPEFAHGIGINARKIVERLSCEKIAKIWREFLQF